MILDEIVARAAPPPERAGGGAFEPVATDPATLARRSAAMIEAFGSRETLAAHTEAIGLSPDAWLARLGDVRLAGGDPPWARAFRAMYERLEDSGDHPFAGVRRWIEAEAKARWPAGLPRGPDALEGPLDYFADRAGRALAPARETERRLGGPPSTWERFFRRSPALAFALGQVAVDWIADISRIAACAAADRALLSRELFDGADPGALVGIEAGLGDPHAGGRSVAILRFERGGAVFKPKDLRVAAAVGEIAGELGAGLAPPGVIVRGDYAWEPVHSARPLPERGDADAFYAALGGWLALLQGLGAIDFWFDNLIADGATPRFIDFETAAQPAHRWSGRAGLPGGAAAARLELSPAGVGILPLQMPTRDGMEPADIGCVSRPGEHRSPVPILGEKEGLLSWREDRFAPHYPDGAPADAADHFDAFEDGYLRAARALRHPAIRGRAVDALSRVADAPVRIILVDTWTCYRTIQHSCLPRHVSDGAWREIALHSVLAPHGELYGPSLEAAARDLRRLDVPLYQTRLDSIDLIGMGGERHPGFLDGDAIAEARRRLDALAGLADDDRAAWLRSVFSTRAGNPPRRRPSEEDAPPAAPADLLSWADDIASRVAELAADDGRGAPTWNGLLHDVFTGIRGVGPLGFETLSGRSGLGTALLELAARLDRPDLAGLAREALAGAARDYMTRAAFDIFASGAGQAVGAGGLVSALAGDDETRPLAREVWALASEREVWMRSGADLASGLAGWREAARALGEPAPDRHGAVRPYAPSARARLAPWLDPEAIEPICADRAAAARMRRDFDSHGSWFAASWLDDRHNLSGVDGLPALAVRFARLAAAS